MKDDYQNIINLPRPKSLYKPMSSQARAAQFSPFAALTGYDQLIDKANLKYINRIDLDESQKQEISTALNEIYNNKDHQYLVRLVYFVPITSSNDGNYQTNDFYIKKIDEMQKQIISIENDIININDIYQLTIIE